MRSFAITASAVEIHVLFGTITSDPFFKLSDLIAISSASVPFPTVIQFFAPTNLAKFFSNNFTSSPPIKFDFFIRDIIF